jgi:hypothetical protein
MAPRYPFASRSPWRAYLTDRRTLSLLIVDDAFHIEGRGTVIAPSIPDNLVRKAARVTLQLRFPSGGPALPASGRIVLEHLRLVGGRSRYQWVLLLDDGSVKPSRGTEILAEQCDPVDALVHEQPDVPGL